MTANNFLLRLITILFLIPSIVFAQEKSKPVGSFESFANGQIQGHWQFHKTWDKETDTYGHRGDHSMYNPQTNKLYVITSGKNLVMGKLEHNGFLELRNQKIYLQGKVFLGLRKPSGGFRLIAGVAVSSEQSNLHYSDDDGMSWKESFGGRFNGSESIWGTVLENQGTRTAGHFTGPKSETTAYSPGQPSKPTVYGSLFQIMVKPTGSFITGRACITGMHQLPVIPGWPIPSLLTEQLKTGILRQ